jgi:hypothetical protein
MQTKQAIKQAIKQAGNKKGNDLEERCLDYSCMAHPARFERATP